MNRDRRAGIFWFVAFLYVVFYVGGQAVDLFEGLTASYHHEVEPRRDPYAGMTPVEIGEKMFKTQGCQACHQIGLVGGTVGPSLSNVGARRNENWLNQQLLDPSEIVPDNYMTSYAFLTDQERAGLVAYLLTLDGNRQGAETTGTVNLDPPARFSEAQIERGLQLFAANGCNGCHRIGADGGAIGPNLTREGLRDRSDDWQKQHLKDPLSVYKDGPTEGILWPMPGFARLADADLDALVAYLQSLR